MASARMATSASGSAGWTDAELFAAAQGAGIAALASLQQENAQLRGKVAVLEGSLRHALEELQALREERRAQEGCAPISVKVLNVADAVAPPVFELKPEAEVGLRAPPELPHLAPPPGLSLPASQPPSPTLSGRSAAAPSPPPGGRLLRGSPGLLAIPSAVQREDSALSRTPTCQSPALTPSSSVGALGDESPRQGPLRVMPAGGVPGVAGTVVEWRVECLHVKLKANCGFPLLSPMFSLGDLSGLRLMFVPGSAWAARQSKGGRKQQAWRRAQGADGPSFGALQLKAHSPGDAVPLRFFLIVGGRRQGPCTCDFSEHAIQGCNFDRDWLHQMDREADSLQLRLEFV